MSLSAPSLQYTTPQHIVLPAFIYTIYGSPKRFVSDEPFVFFHLLLVRRLDFRRKCKKSVNQDLPKYIYYRESKCGKYKGYTVEHPNGTKRFTKSSMSLEKRLEKAIQHLNELEKNSPMNAVQRLDGGGFIAR